MNQETYCKHCQIALDYPKRLNKFCSRSCAASHNNLGKRRHGNAPGNCPVCETKLRRNQNKYCSLRCQGVVTWGRTKEIIETGSRQVSVVCLRKYLRETRSHRCEVCGLTEWRGNPAPLVMDHIDGNPANDLPGNLRWVCANCDRFLPTFGSRNKGKGRKSRGLRRL